MQIDLQQVIKAQAVATGEVNYSLTLRADSHDDAVAWTSALRDALAATRDYDPKAGKVKEKPQAPQIDKE